MAAVDGSQQYWDASALPPLGGSPQITPEYVMSLTRPTDGFLCPLSANTKGLDFIRFSVRSVEDGYSKALFDVARPDGAPPPPPETLDDNSRFIRYNFGPDFLNYTTIGTTLEFSIGDEPVHDLLMIERHYFREQLVQSYEFTLPFVIPGTRNTWEMIYTKPEFNDEWKNALISYPYETRSDSFYFVEGVLVMHNRAEYSFTPLA
jgi:hypothetical protein